MSDLTLERNRALAMELDPSKEGDLWWTPAENLDSPAIEVRRCRLGRRRAQQPRCVEIMRTAGGSQVMKAER